MKLFLSILLALLAVGMGAVAFVYSMQTAPGPGKQRPADLGRLVRVFEVHQANHLLALTAYGTTRPAHTWEPMCEVKGEIIAIHRDFSVGSLLPKGTVLARIDPTDYQLALAQAETQISLQQHTVAELTQQLENLENVVNLHQRQARLAEKEMSRQRQLLERRAGSQHDLDQAETLFVQRSVAAAESNNTKKLIPIRIEQAKAKLKAAKVQRDQLQRDIKRCEIKLPFDARCVGCTVDEGQSVLIGDRLGKFYGLQTIEVLTMAEFRKAQALFPTHAIEKSSTSSERSRSNALGWHSPDIERASRQSYLDPPLKALVSYGDEPRRYSWAGHLTRLAGTLDRRSRSVQAIVEVQHPYRDAGPGRRPPLIPDMFCEVVVFGSALQNVVVVPRQLVRNNQIAIIKNRKLHFVPVHVLAEEEDLAVIDQGLHQGDLVILSDLFPAVEGMHLRPQVVSNPVSNRITYPSELLGAPNQTQTASADTPSVRSTKGFWNTSASHGKTPDDSMENKRMENGVSTGRMIPASALGFWRSSSNVGAGAGR